MTLGKVMSKAFLRIVNPALLQASNGRAARRESESPSIQVGKGIVRDKIAPYVFKNAGYGLIVRVVFHVCVCVFFGRFLLPIRSLCRGKKGKQAKKKRKSEAKESPPLAMRGKPALAQAPPLISHVKGRESPKGKGSEGKRKGKPRGSNLSKREAAQGMSLKGGYGNIYLPLKYPRARAHEPSQAIRQVVPLSFPFPHSPCQVPACHRSASAQ